MKTVLDRLQVLLAASLLFDLTACQNKPAETTNPAAQNYSLADLAQRTVERRGVEAVIWGMPAVNYDLMLQEMWRMMPACLPG